MYSTTIYITFWGGVKVGGAVFFSLFYDSTMVAPSGEAAATLRWLHLCWWAITDTPEQLIQSHPPLFWGRHQTICLDIFWGLGHHDTTPGFPEDKNSPLPPLDLQGRTRPFHRITTWIRPHPSLQQDGNHHLMVLPPPWPAGWQLLLWLCQFKPVFLNHCLYCSFPLKL